MRTHCSGNLSYYFGLSTLIHILHKPEIRDFINTIFESENIRRLYIAMQETQTMHVGETISNHDQDISFLRSR